MIPFVLSLSLAICQFGGVYTATSEELLQVKHLPDGKMTTNDDDDFIESAEGIMRKNMYRWLMPAGITFGSTLAIYLMKFSR